MRSTLRQSGALSLVALLCVLFAAVRPNAQSAWSDADIGSPFIFGSSWNASGFYGLIGGGSGLTDSSDQFHFLSQRVSGDIDIKACVEFLIGIDPATSTGVMVRQSLDPGAPAVSVLLSTATGVALHARATAGAPVAVGAYSPGSTPTCMRLVRQGSTFTAYGSDTGANWTSLGSTTVSMGADVYVGLAIASHSPFLKAQSMLSNVAVTVPAPSTVPEPPSAA